MSAAVEEMRASLRRAGVRAALARRRDMLVIGGAALVLRTAWVLAFGRIEAGPNDTLFYQLSATQLAQGHGFGYSPAEPSAHWPPGYPFLVSLLYRLFGDQRELALGLNVVLATATAILLYLV